MAQVQPNTRQYDAPGAESREEGASSGASNRERIFALEAQIKRRNILDTAVFAVLFVAVGALIFSTVTIHRMGNTDDTINRLANGTVIGKLIDLEWLTENRLNALCGFEITFLNITDALKVGLLLESDDDSLSFRKWTPGKTLDINVRQPTNELNFTSSDSSIIITGAYPTYDFVVNGFPPSPSASPSPSPSPTPIPLPSPSPNPSPSPSPMATPDWTLRESDFGGGWNEVVWSPQVGLFVAVNIYLPGDEIMTSPDGITWTLRSTGLSNAWTSVTWAPELGLYVSVARAESGNSQVMTSPDGINWTGRASATAEHWYSVTWSPELGLLVAVSGITTAAFPTAMTSPDGVNWTTRNIPFRSSCFSVTWSAELGIFVAACSGNTVSFMTSTNGINWVGSPAALDGWRSVVWSADLGLFVSVGVNGSGGKVVSSPDGTTWTNRTSDPGKTWEAVTWSPERGLFVGVGSSADFAVLYSSNGIDWWTEAAQPGGWRSVCWSPDAGLFVAVSTSSAVAPHVMTSPG